MFRKKQLSNNSKLKFKHVEIRVSYKPSTPKYCYCSQFAEKKKKSIFFEVQIFPGGNFIPHCSSFMFCEGCVNINSQSRWTSSLIWECHCWRTIYTLAVSPMRSDSKLSSIQLLFQHQRSQQKQPSGARNWFCEVKHETFIRHTLYETIPNYVITQDFFASSVDIYSTVNSSTFAAF